MLARSPHAPPPQLRRTPAAWILAIALAAVGAPVAAAVPVVEMPFGWPEIPDAPTVLVMRSQGYGRCVLRWGLDYPTVKGVAPLPDCGDMVPDPDMGLVALGEQAFTDLMFLVGEEPSAEDDAAPIPLALARSALAPAAVRESMLVPNRFSVGGFGSSFGGFGGTGGGGHGSGAGLRMARAGGEVTEAPRGRGDKGSESDGRSDRRGGGRDDRRGEDDPRRADPPGRLEAPRPERGTGEPPTGADPEGWLPEGPPPEPPIPTPLPQSALLLLAGLALVAPLRGLSRGRSVQRS